MPRTHETYRTKVTKSAHAHTRIVPKPKREQLTSPLYTAPRPSSFSSLSGMENLNSVFQLHILFHLAFTFLGSSGEFGQPGGSKYSVKYLRVLHLDSKSFDVGIPETSLQHHFYGNWVSRKPGIGHRTIKGWWLSALNSSPPAYPRTFSSAPLAP